MGTEDETMGASCTSNITRTSLEHRPVATPLVPRSSVASCRKRLALYDMSFAVASCRARVACAGLLSGRCVESPILVDDMGREAVRTLRRWLLNRPGVMKDVAVLGLAFAGTGIALALRVSLAVGLPLLVVGAVTLWVVGMWHLPG